MQRKLLATKAGCMDQKKYVNHSINKGKWGRSGRRQQRKQRCHLRGNLQIAIHDTTAVQMPAQPIWPGSDTTFAHAYHEVVPSKQGFATCPKAGYIIQLNNDLEHELTNTARIIEVTFPSPHAIHRGAKAVVKAMRQSSNTSKHIAISSAGSVTAQEQHGRFCWPSSQRGMDGQEQLIHRQGCFSFDRKPKVITTIKWCAWRCHSGA